MAIKESPSASIAAEESQIAKAVLMPGDPLRAKYVADHYLEEVVCFNTVRNMLGYTGTYKGKRISVMGHGMGVPSMGIYSYELYQFFGVDTIIRIGSAGGIGDDVKVRDVVIALGASTNSHFADQYRFPGQLCATADFRLLRDAVETAEAMGVRADVGQVFTADQFYNDNSDAGAMYRKFGILALEMETAGLYWTAQRLGKRALSLLTISGSNHRPNCIPCSCTKSTSGCNPSGHTSGSTHQSPRPAWSSRRRWNQPSSSTYRSTPIAAARRAISSSVSRLWSNITPSHTLSTTGWRRGCAGSERSH